MFFQPGIKIKFNGARERYHILGYRGGGGKSTTRKRFRFVMFNLGNGMLGTGRKRKITFFACHLREEILAPTCSFWIFPFFYFKHALSMKSEENEKAITTPFCANCLFDAQDHFEYSSLFPFFLFPSCICVGNRWR